MSLSTVQKAYQPQLDDLGYDRDVDRLMEFILRTLNMLKEEQLAVSKKLHQVSVSHLPNYRP